MSPKAPFRLVTLFAAIVLAVVVAGCGMRAERSAKIQPDWSRGEKVGVAGWNQPGGIAVEPDGRAVYLAWITPGPDLLGLSYARLDPRGRILTDRPLGANVYLPREARLIRTDTGKLLFFSRASPTADAMPGVILVVINPDGNEAGPFRLLSRDGAAVQAYAAAAGPDGRVIVVWATTEPDGARLEYLQLDGEGRPVEPLLQITSGARDPAVAVDSSGAVHLVWLRQFSGQRYEMVYANFQASAAKPTAGTLVSTFAGSTGTSFEQPAIGLDSGYVYVFWSRVERAGVEAGTGQTFYVAFPPGQPAFLEPARLQVPPDGKPAYLPYQGSYNLHEIAGLPGAGFMGTDTLRMPAPVAGQRADLAVAFSANMKFGRFGQVVPILIFFRDGLMTGYQVVARPDQHSIFPIITADATGNLYASWLSSSTDVYDVYYASTAPELKTVLDKKDISDYVIGGRDLVWGMLQGLTLFATLPAIYFPALAVLIGYTLFGAGQHLDKRRPKTVILVAVGLYLAAKLVMWYRVLANPPLLGLVPPALELVWLPVVPLGIAGAAALITRAILSRREQPSLYAAAALFCALDSVLTMLLYGPTAFS